MQKIKILKSIFSFSEKWFIFIFFFFFFFFFLHLKEKQIEIEDLNRLELLAEFFLGDMKIQTELLLKEFRIK
jgi:hypothetical protein